MRNDHQFRADAVHIEETGHKEAADLTGISGLAILAQLPSIEFPRSFPPDSMHLFFENVVPALVRHYRGVFFKTDHNADGARTASDSDQLQPLLQPPLQPPRKAPGGSQKRTWSAMNSLSTAAPGATRGSNIRGGQGAANSGIQVRDTRKLKFKRTSDPWNIEPKVWERIGRDQEVLNDQCSWPSSYPHLPPLHLYMRLLI
jgi:hypothetical protein